MRIGLGKDKRKSPGSTEWPFAAELRRNVAEFTGDHIALGHIVTEEYFGVQGIGSGVTGFVARADPGPIMHGNLGVAAARRNPHSTAVLLGAGGPVRKTIVGRDVVELRGRLVVPRAPSNCAVFGDDSALIAGKDHAFRVVGINPELVIIIAARRAPDGRPILAAVSGTIKRSV